MLRLARMRIFRGTTLVAVTAIGVAVSCLGMTMIELGYHSRILAVRNVQDISARCAADAGMADAIFMMNKKLIDEPVWDNGTLPSRTDIALPNSLSKFTYSVTGSQATGFEIVSTGTCGTAQKSVHVLLNVGSYLQGVGVKETADIFRGATLGTDPPGSPIGMIVRTNSIATDALKFKAFVTVPGDVLCGPGGITADVVDTKATTVIKGSTYAAAEKLEFPLPVPPSGLPAGPNMPTTVGESVTLTPGAYQYAGITLPNSSQLKISGDTVIYVVGPIIFNKDAQLIVESTGSLKLYLGTSLEDKNATGISGIFNNTNSSNNLRIYGCAGSEDAPMDIDLKAKSTLYAAIYAPNADIDLFNSGDFHGAIVGYSFEMKNSGNLYYDTSLATALIDSPEACFIVGHWWED